MAKNRKEFVELRVVLADIVPEIWRRVIVPSATTLDELHRIIQLMFEWCDYHLYEFEVSGVKYQAPDAEAEGEDSTRARLSRLGLSIGAEFTYTYDFGDDWVHRIRVESLRVEEALDDLPYVVAGERRGPPEDCGGPSGFERFLNAMKNPRDPEHDEYRMWAGEDYVPDRFDIGTVRHAVMLATAWGRRTGREEL